MNHDDEPVSWASTSVRHGTPSGWSLHQRLGERPCDPCYRAKADYDTRQRALPAKIARDRQHAKAQAVATTWLRQAHPAEWADLYTAAKEQVSTEFALREGVTVDG